MTLAGLDGYFELAIAYWMSSTKVTIDSLVAYER